MASHGTGETATQASKTEPVPPNGPRPPRGLAATFRSLRHRNYRLYFFGQLISLTGTWMQSAALAWLAFDLTHQSKWPALVSTAQILPTFLFGAWGGSLADRWPKRTVIFWSQAAFLVLALALSVLAYGDFIHRQAPWELVIVTALAGLVQAVDLPARMTFVMDMTSREDLMNAVALNSLLFNLARAIGPALTGILLASFKPWACFFANALSYVAVLWALASMDVVPASHHPGRAHVHRSLADGFLYLARHRTLGFLFLLSTTTTMFGWPFLTLLPALADHTLHLTERGYAWMVSGTGVGALVAAWSVATIGSVQRGRILIATGVSIVTLALIGLAAAGNLPLALVCCGFIGFGLILFLSTTQSVVQLSAGDHNRGLIMGIWSMILSGAIPLGNLVAGLAADAWGERQVLLVEGIACGATALALLILFRPGRMAD